MKTSPDSIDTKARAKLREGEIRRLRHAYDTFVELLEKHIHDERDVAELFRMRTMLEHAIKNQHIKDKDYAAYKTPKEFTGLKGF